MVRFKSLELSKAKMERKIKRFNILETQQGEKGK